MKSIRAAFFVISIILLSCNKNDNDPVVATDLITIEADATSIPYTDIWFVVWAQNGAVLDSRKYTPGQPMKLTTPAPFPNNKITLGYFRYREESTYTDHLISIYTDLTPGIVFTREGFIAPQSPGAFKLTLTNEPLSGYPNISSKYGLVSNLASGNGTETLYDCELQSDATKYIVTWVGEPGVYGELNDVGPGDELDLDVSELKSFEHEASFNMPADYSAMSIYFRGFEADQPYEDGGYFLDVSNTGVYHPTYTSGYFSPITKFALELNANYDGAYATYLKYGSLPGTITWPDPSKYTINSSEPLSLSVSTEEPVEYIAAQWFNSVGTDYHSLTITSPSLTPAIAEIPNDILTARPGFALTKANLPQMQVWFIVGGSQSYEEEMEEFFTGKAVDQEVMRIAISGN